MALVNISNGTSDENQNSSSFVSVLDDSSRHPRIVFLALFIVTTLVGNICLIIVIVQNKKYRGTIPNLIILNLCVVNLLDCVLNMPLVFGSLIATDWVYGVIMCRFNTFCMNIVIVETVLTLTALTIDRVMAVKIMPSKYGSILSPSRTYIALGYTWFHSFGFSLPLLAGAVPSTFRKPLHLCSISDSSSLTFICLTSIICFVAPVIAMLVLYALIIKAAYKERFAVRSKLAEHTYTEKSIGKPQIWKEIDIAKYSGLLFILWVVFEVPYIVTTYIKQYQFSQEFQANPNIGEIDYPWVVDVTFVWVRFAFSGILPILTFTWKREFWRSWKDTILCRRSNSITDSVAFARPQVNRKDHLSIPSVKSKEREKIESPSALTFNVPVLFATANGIHVQTDQGNMADSDIFYAEMPSTTRSSSELKFLKGKKLDVVSALEFTVETSDYDSNSEAEVADPYSLSQPVSSRQLEHTEQDKVSRSSSHPEIPERRSSSRTSNIRPFEAKLTTVSYGTDSGLDLSGHGGTSNTRSSLTAGSNVPNNSGDQENRTFVMPDGVGPDVVEKESNFALTKENGSTFVVGNKENGKLDQKFLGTTYTHQDMPQGKVPNTPKIKTDNSAAAKKPPLHLEPLSGAKSDFKQTRRKKSKQVKSQDSGSSLGTTRSLGQGQEGERTPKKQSRPGHKRQGTAESQKALLGSSSSAELQDMKAELQKMEEQERIEDKTLSGQAGEGAGEMAAKKTDMSS